MRIQTAVMLLLAFGSACSRPAPPPASTAASAPAPAASPSATTVSGTVTDIGPGITAFVLLEPKPPREFPAPAAPPVMDQVGETFGPPVLFVRTGQPVEFRNNDDTLHSVHVTNADTHEAAFNVAIPTGNSYSYTFARDGFYHVGCDIHPAMAAEIVSASTPYVTTAGGDGRYAFEDVAPGTYALTTLVAGKKTQREIEVTAPQSPGTPSRE